jgi:hypothetical protein
MVWIIQHKKKFQHEGILFHQTHMFGLPFIDIDISIKII